MMRLDPSLAAPRQSFVRESTSFPSAHACIAAVLACGIVMLTGCVNVPTQVPQSEGHIAHSAKTRWQYSAAGALEQLCGAGAATDGETADV